MLDVVGEEQIMRLKSCKSKKKSAGMGAGDLNFGEWIRSGSLQSQCSWKCVRLRALDRQ